jgi:hypothetical protein
MRGYVHSVNVIPVQNPPVIRIGVRAETLCHFSRRILLDIGYSYDLSPIRHLVIRDVQAAKYAATANNPNSDLFHSIYPHILDNTVRLPITET